MANIVEIILRGVDKTKDGFSGAIKNFEDVEKGVGKLKGTLLGIGERLDQVKPFFIGLAATAAGAFTAMAKSSIDAADQAGKLAQSAGLTTEAFTQLSYAAEASTVKGDSFRVGMKGLNEEIANAQAGNEKSIELFRAMGVAFQDAEGKARAGDLVFLDLAEKFNQSADGASKAAAATLLFGKAGQDLIPMLNQGKEGISALIAESDALGQTFSGETAKAADDFNSNLARLKSGLIGVVNTVVAEFLPASAQFIGDIVDWTRETGVFKAAAATLIDVFKVLKYTIDVVITAVKGLFDAFNLLGNLIGNVFSNIVDTFDVIGKGIGSIAAAAYEALKGNFTMAKDIANTALSDIDKSFKTWGAGVGETITQAEADWKSLMETMAKGPTAPTLSGLQSLFDAEPEDVTVTRTTVDARVVKPSMRLPDADLESQSIITGDYGPQLAGNEKLRKLKAEMTMEGLQGFALEKAKEAETFQQRLAHIQASAKSHDDYLKGAALAEEAYKKATLKLELDAAKQVKEMRQDLENDRIVSKGDPLSEFELARTLAQQELDQKLENIKLLGVSKEEARALEESAELTHQHRLTEITKQESDARAQIHQHAAGVIGGIFGNLAGVVQAFGKKGFAAFKAFSIAQAVMDTYGAAIAAYKSAASIPVVGFTLAPIAAAAAIAFGMARVSAISSQQPVGQAHSGLEHVPSEGTYLLQAGERVLQPTQNRDLTEFLRGVDHWRDLLPPAEMMATDTATAPLTTRIIDRTVERVTETSRTQPAPMQNMLPAPARESAGPTSIVVNTYIGGDKVGQALYRLSRDGQLTIHPNAVREA